MSGMCMVAVWYCPACGRVWGGVPLGGESRVCTACAHRGDCDPRGAGTPQVEWPCGSQPCTCDVVLGYLGLSRDALIGGWNLEKDDGGA